MSEGIFETLAYYFTFPFVRYALIVGVLVALCASLLGVVLVLKRYSHIGDGLAHVAFGAMAVATALRLTNQMVLVLPLTMASAVALLWNGQSAKIKGDAAIAMLSVSAMAIGYLLLNIFPSSSNISGDVCTTLFGSTSILTLTPTKVWLSVGLSLLVAAVFVLFYNRIFAITFDEGFAAATGLNTRFYNLVVALIVATVVVLAMDLVGSLLTSALIIFPALSVMRVLRSFKAVVIASVILGVFCAAVGILLSILMGTPVGATIVVVYLAVFILFSLGGLALGRRRA
ncbi:MAG: metal ABC transporter permease [Eubacteriales bacterium]|nr:metal ABC transporter permease [Eubacteriales bacterium]